MPIEETPHPISNEKSAPQEVSDGQAHLAEDAKGGDSEHPGVAVPYENHVVPRLARKGIGHLVMSSEERAGGRFLHKYGSLDQDEVSHVIGYLRSSGTSIPDKAGDRTAAYIDFMNDKEYVGDGILTGDPESIRRQIDTYIIKADEVPESYFALQARILRERGHGDVEITPEHRRQLIEAAQADQRGSLERWAEYIGGDDGAFPGWFKRYAFDSMLKLGSYDKEKAKFTRREADTVAPYPELNREALAYVYDTVKQFHVLGNEEVDDAKLKQLLKEGSFGRLYAHAITEVTPDGVELRSNIEGSWTKFSQTSDPRTARRLAGSLQGHGTGWCTAGESTAESQLAYGDFYVYYTRDENGKDTIPRVAVRMENGEVAEVRGVLPDQNMEPVMDEVVQEKLATLPGGEEYVRMAADMKRLTNIERIVANNPHAELSVDDLCFLYELDRKIEGFGYEDDPRIHELLRVRDTTDDLNKVFASEPEWQGDLNLPSLTSVEGLQLPKEIGGYLDLNGLTSSKGLQLPKEIGDLYLGGLTSAEGLQLPEQIGGDLSLYSLTSAEGLQLPEQIGNLYLTKLTSAEGLQLPKEIGNLNLSGLTSAEGLQLPKEIGGDLSLFSLTSAEGLQLPKEIGGDLSLFSLTSAEGLQLPEQIGGDLDLFSLTSAEGLQLPEQIGNLSLYNLTSAEGLQLPEQIGGNLDLFSLTSAEGLRLPKEIGGYLDLRNLTSVEGLQLPEQIGGYLDLSGLTSAEGLRLPKEIGGDLALRGLTSAEGLRLPEQIGGDLDLSGLTSAEGLRLPKEIGGDLNLRSLDFAKKRALALEYRYPESRII